MQHLVARREQWRDELTWVGRMHRRVLEAEAILAGSWAPTLDDMTNMSVGTRFDAWWVQLRQMADAELLAETERRCLAHFLHVTENLRPRLIQCYDGVGIPRTNNDMEGFIRAIKTRCRRISGRKNWNRYLLRYGRRVAYYEARVRMPEGQVHLEQAVRGVGPDQWRTARVEQQTCQEEQLKQYRFRHKRIQFLQELEARWAATA